MKYMDILGGLLITEYCSYTNEEMKGCMMAIDSLNSVSLRDSSWNVFLNFFVNIVFI